MSALNANPSRQLVVKFETVTFRYLKIKDVHSYPKSKDGKPFERSLRLEDSCLKYWTLFVLFYLSSCNYKTS